jgi:hypothetical protein
MILVSLAPWTRFDRQERTPVWSLDASLRYGFTDRLQWTDLTSLEYAVLDDSPGRSDGTALPDALSLSVRAGAKGVGWSSIEGFITTPLLVVSGLKHLGEDAAVGASAGYFASWVAQPWPETRRYGVLLWPGGAQWSELTLDSWVQKQVTTRVAATLVLGVHELHDCSLLACSWASRGAVVSLGPAWRYWHWLTLSISGSAGVRYRPSGVVGSVVPDEPTAQPPGSVSWAAIQAAVVLHW